jgi:hypothetical protein
MVFAIPAALLFCLLVFGTIRWASHKPGHALVAFLAGFFVAGTGAAPVIDNVLTSIVTALTHAKH